MTDGSRKIVVPTYGSFLVRYPRLFIRTSIENSLRHVAGRDQCYYGFRVGVLCCVRRACVSAVFLYTCVHLRFDVAAMYFLVYVNVYI